MSAYPLILTLDPQGVPHRWVTWQHACFYYAKDLVAWAIGDNSFVIHGGLNRLTGQRSEICANSIIAIKGRALAGRQFQQVPPLDNHELFHRDRHICAYCGERLTSLRLTRDHILPVSQGGSDIWMNVVTACILSGPKHSSVYRVSEWKRRRRAIWRQRVTSKTYGYESPVCGRRP